MPEGTVMARLARVTVPGWTARSTVPSGIVKAPWPSVVALYVPSASEKVKPAPARPSAVLRVRQGAAAVHGLASEPFTTSAG